MRLASWLWSACLLTACTSYGATNSPVTDLNAAEVPELVGRWRSISDERGHLGGDTLCVTITPLAVRPHRIRMDGCRPGVREADVKADFTRLGDELFVALQPALSDTAALSTDDVLALYSFYRIRMRNDSMLVSELNADSLRTFLVHHPTALPYALLEGNGPDLLLTGTPDQLAAFLAMHARDSSLFGGEEAVLPFGRLR